MGIEKLFSKKNVLTAAIILLSPSNVYVQQNPLPNNYSLVEKYTINGKMTLPETSKEEGWVLEREIEFDGFPQIPGNETIIKRYDNAPWIVVKSSFKNNPEKAYSFQIINTKTKQIGLYSDKDADGIFEPQSITNPKLDIDYDKYVNGGTKK